MSWDTLDEFASTLALWGSTQDYLESIGAQRSYTRMVSFKEPALDGNILTLPNGPEREDDGELSEHLWVTHDGPHHYTLHGKRRERSHGWEGPLKTFSHFELAGKYILAKYNTGFRRLIGLSEITTQWIGRDPQEGWITNEIPPLPENAYRTTRFIKFGTPEMSFIGEPYEAMYTYPMSMTYQQLTNLVMSDVPQPA